mmetsp:Transcript_29776/g.61902  ORF Transcript_29776/g.61902 Transcript_29776/m.61902 type:complete len:502 (-) Transcript_29776:310-1815(-)|eukprot:CAMPEP_0171342972 /NCGR_PEP_ID=MMETSP0878-20121228/15903_1 /TAXON_ID=67004 /ORGANISM="Thalassiosira weissflogii, Strain CCMP1336" /LENGTH=501 /DNA_ID=CAMNT_0011845795 /DNA_START=23 /DNA_END=1528 /DNA_ORIENTATION=+
MTKNGDLMGDLPCQPRKSRRNKAQESRVQSSDRHFVVHNYNDHSREKSSDYPMLHSDGDFTRSCEGGDDSSKRRGPRGGVSVPFPTKLHVMLSKVEEEGLGHVVSWQPHGRCFAVHDPKAFVENIMPKYFRQSKLTSFQRQLNLYGFCRLTSGTDRGAYYHELFLRHRLFLCQRMTRIRIKGTGIKGKASPETEPDFYSMPFLHPNEDTPDMKKIDEIVAAAMEENESIPAKRPSNRRHSGRKKANIAKTTKKTNGDRELQNAPRETHVTTAIVTPEARRPLPNVDLCPGHLLPFIPNTTPANIQSQVKNDFRLQPRGYFSGRGKSPSTSFNPAGRNNFAPVTRPSSCDDKVTFEGKQFHYLDSLAAHDPMKNEFIPRQEPSQTIQWDHSFRSKQPYPAPTMSSNQVFSESRTASNVSLPRLVSSIETSEGDLNPIEMSLRGPLLTPSSSSSSLYGMSNNNDVSLEFINPDTIFAPTSPNIEWEINQDVDIDVEFSLLVES